MKIFSSLPLVVFCAVIIAGVVECENDDNGWEMPFTIKKGAAEKCELRFKNAVANVAYTIYKIVRKKGEKYCHFPYCIVPNSADSRLGMRGVLKEGNFMVFSRRENWRQFYKVTLVQNVLRDFEIGSNWNLNLTIFCKLPHFPDPFVIFPHFSDPNICYGLSFGYVESIDGSCEDVGAKIGKSIQKTLK